MPAFWLWVAVGRLCAEGRDHRFLLVVKLLHARANAAQRTRRDALLPVSAPVSATVEPTCRSAVAGDDGDGSRERRADLDKRQRNNAQDGHENAHCSEDEDQKPAEHAEEDDERVYLGAIPTKPAQPIWQNC